MGTEDGRKSKRIIREWLNSSSGFFYTAGKTLYAGKTKFQSIELLETAEFGNTLLLDGVTQVVQKNDFQYHEPMVHFAMLAHPNPRTLLVIGGGDGGILREALRYKCVESIDFAELDEEVVEFSKRHLPEINGGAFDDPRVNFRFQDGRAFAESRIGAYDVVIMDMTDPVGPSRMLYTAEFFQAVRRSLRDEKGIFVMHSESPITRPAAFGCILQTLGSVFRHSVPLFTFIQMYATLWSIAVSSDASDIRLLDAAEVDRRIERAGLSNLKMMNGRTWTAMQASYPYIDDILRANHPIITDAKPDFPDSFDQKN